MKHRNPLTVFLLSIVTLGIYDLYWLVQTKNTLNKETNRHVPTIWLLVGPWIFVVINYIALFAITPSSYEDESTGAASSSESEWSVALAIAFIGIFVGFLLATILNVVWYYRYSKAVDAYTNGKMSTAVSFLILYLVHLIGVVLIQDAFNEVADNRSQQPQQPQAAAAMNPAAPPALNAQPQPQQPITNPLPPENTHPPQAPPPPAS